jgi:hypothetical protein
LIWNTFQTEIKNFQIFKGQLPEVKNLFHGTSDNDPKNIYSHKEGFDMRFSAGGMWGPANYFAANASYSDAYSHKIAGTRQMFQARVMVGNTKTCNPNKDLKMPPAISADNALDLYDSVHGRTGGSDVFVIYTNKQAYPEYLITYS